MDYKNFNDNELIYMVKENDDQAVESIYCKYKPLVKNVASKYFYQAKQVGLELEDLVQEGMVGLCNAAYSFNQERDNIFYTYALVSIRRTIIKSIYYNGSKKKMVLNKAVSCDEEIFENTTLIETVTDNNTHEPLNIVTGNEFNFELINFMNKLSFIYSQVFELKLNGFKHMEIAKLLDIKDKMVDNACIAIRKKMKLQNFIYLSI